MDKEIIQKLKKLPFFTLDSVKPQAKKNPLPSIKYYLKTKKIIRIKRGIYVFKDFVNKEGLQGKTETYLEFLANKLVQPSYLSLEYVLAKYSLASEAVYGLTSITLKTPRQINNELASFSYRKIKNSLFCGYNTIKKENYLITEATKSKALFDFLYFQKRGLKTINPTFIKELRLNLEEMEKPDWQEFEKYVKISKSKKMKIISKLINPYAS